MEIQKYKEMFYEMMRNPVVDFGFVSGSKNKFYISASGYRITWDHSANTIRLPSMFEDDVYQNSSNSGTLSAAQMVARLRNAAPDDLEYYIPTSDEDEFQASTARLGHILPFELVVYLERLLCIAQERIGRYSIDERKSK